MTQDEMVGVAKWAVDLADEQRVAYSDVINGFKDEYKRDRDVTKAKNMIEQGMVENANFKDNW